jgi:transcriptional regulator with XRE-family HTH domain
MTIGDRLKRQRVRRGYSQTELARLSGVKQSLISRIENGSRDNPSADVLRGLAKALGCTTDYLVGMYENEEDATLSPVAEVMVPA